MGRLLRWVGWGLVSIFGLILIASVVVWLISSAKLNANARGRPEHLARPSAAELADAPRQLRVLRCLDCHSSGLRGALFFDQPNIARFYAPNLTLIAAKASDEQLAQAIRQGVGTDGRALVAMPSATFSRLDDSEVAAVIAAIRALPAGGKVTPARKIGPLGRLGLVIGKFHTQPELVSEYAHKVPLDAGSQFRIGRHMAASNCAECHGPDLRGDEVEPGVNAPDLMVAGAYDLPAFTKLMRTGAPPGGRKLKLMDSIAKDDLSHMTDTEIGELYAYLQARAERLSR
jgi:cytochrome c553